MTNKIEKLTTQELHSEVELRMNEIKQYAWAYGPRVLLVGGATVASYFVIKLIIKRLTGKH